MILRAIVRFTRIFASSGVLLMAAAAVALGWANSPFAASHERLLATPFTVGAGALVISKPLLLWINDGLMAIFFFVVGLEIKREILVGELASPAKAALAIAAAAGGMAVPATIYWALNGGTPGAPGWGIPMATDIAFALGVLALIGERVPLALKVFLTALAIVDDLGAVAVIALFYTETVSWSALAGAGVVLLALVALNRLGARNPLPFVVLGLVLWVFVLESGVHATIAGVLLAFTIPASRRVDPAAFAARARSLVDAFERERGAPGELTSGQSDALGELESATEDVETPLARLEHALHPWVAFGVMPVFALANAGLRLDGDLASAATSRVALGIALGLLIGKQIGVLGAAWLAVRAGIASLPEGVRWRQVWGASLLAGIGFTMSLFIAGLAFPSPSLLAEAKLGILAGSLVAGIAGWIVLARVARNEGA
jgi:NhaA family Na+:H+ antiporter